MTHVSRLIRRYMARHKIRTQQEFADLVGLSPQYVWDLITERYAECGRKAARKIEDGTRGEIRYEALVLGRPGRRKRAEPADRAAKRASGAR